MLASLVGVHAWARRTMWDGGSILVSDRVRLPEPLPAPFFTQQASYPWLVVACACFGGFMGQLDASIVQLAMPSLETAFDAPVNAVSWVAVGYMLAVACALPIFARLAEIAGRKTFFLSGFASFAILSTLCGLAPTLASLTGLRVLLGVGAAMTGANSVVILVTAAGPERRGKALGVMAAAQAVGFALGPTLGGLLLGTLGWRWVFWVNVPLSVAAFVLSWLIVPKTAAFAGDKRFDWPGAMLLVPGLATLLVAIAQFHAWGLSPLLVACVVAAPILLAGFVWRELGTAFPLVDLRLFRSRSFSAGRDWRPALVRDAFRNVLCDVVRFRARLSRSADDRRATPHHHSDCARNRRALRGKRF